MTRLALAVMLAGVTLAGCGELAAESDTEEPATAFTLTSSAFIDAQPVPRKHAKDPEGENVSPPLAWTDAPAGTLSFALIVDDPDAPSADNPRPEGPWIHWVALVPATRTEVPENYSATANTQGRNDSGQPGYCGPFPPIGSGTHRYIFTLYALDVLDPVVPAEFTKADLLRAIEGHVLDKAVLTGTYER